MVATIWQANSTVEAVPLALPASARHGQADRAGHEPQADHDADDHPPVAEGQLVAAGGRPVVNPRRAVDLLSPAAVGGVVDRQHDYRVVVQHMGDDQVQHDQTYGVDRPHRGGEEPMDPVM
jgi:predicted membrane-bound mannosyltransferase